MRFSGISHQSIQNKIFNINHRQKSRDKLLKEKDLGVPKVVGQEQQNTYDRRNKKHNILGAVIQN